MSSFYKENYLENQNKLKKEMKKTVENILKSFKESPENVIEYLKFCSKFYNYSDRNNRLIMAQNKYASFVGSFSYFQKLGYRVKKGEKSIKILAPYEIKFVKLEDNSLKPLSSFTKEEQKEYLKSPDMIIKKKGFKYVSVFDISQTDCPKEDYPKIIGIGYSSNHHNKLYNILKQYSISKGIDVIEQSLNSITLKGKYTPSYNQITINNMLEDTQKLSVLTHELGHAILHNDNENKNKSSYQIELEADCFSILMYSRLGLDIEDSIKGHLINQYEKCRSDNNFDIDKIISYVYSEYYNIMHDIEETLSKEIPLEKQLIENKLDNKLSVEKEINNITYLNYDSQRELEEIRNINIVDLVYRLGYTPQKKGNLYNLKEHDSLVIYPNTNSFFQFSTGKGGSVVDLHMALTGSNLKDSIKELKEYANIKDSYNYSNNMRYKDISDHEKLEENKKFELPKKSDKGYKNMFAYLIKQRCIDNDIVTSMMKRKLIYQDENRNVVFVGYNKDKEPVCATKRSTNTGSNFKGDVLGSDKSHGFYVDNKSDTLFVAESPIDILSIMTVQKLKNEDYKQNNYLALSDKSHGFYVDNKSDTLFVAESPIDILSIMTVQKLKNEDYKQNNYLALLGATNYKALENTLEYNKSITKVILCMDNDNAGKKALEELKKIIQTIKL